MNEASSAELVGQAASPPHGGSAPRLAHRAAGGVRSRADLQVSDTEDLAVRLTDDSAWGWGAHVGSQDVNRPSG